MNKEEMKELQNERYNGVSIVQATLADLSMLLEWRMEVLRCVFALPANAETADLRQANERYYQRELPSGGHVACLAVDTGKTIGCGGLCLYNELPSPDNPSGRCAYLMNIYVCPDCRRHGVAKCIVRWLVGQALQRGITKIYLETSESGRKLYEVLGFSEMKDMMTLKCQK